MTIVFSDLKGSTALGETLDSEALREVMSRYFDAMRAERPENLKRPGNNPLHQIAAVVATFGEAAAALAEYAELEKWPDWVTALCGIFATAGQNVADWLLILAGKLDDQLGPNWAEKFEMPSWRP